MSKRFGFDQHNGDRKKARLDVTISDHNFPLSQMNSNKEPERNNWGDDNDDEILLLASQACEEAYNDSLIPDYSLCMQPESTSTQYEPKPSSSKAPFTFKKPSNTVLTSSTTNLKNKCSTISSPLPGMSTKIESHNIQLNNDFEINDKVCKGQDPDYMYRQLLQLQEDNAKLKSENGKLLEKCVTKEGETSILRTQLKASQVAVDNARMEKIRAQDKVQIEWTEKIAACNTQIHDLRTQLDFKNLEIISIKERCKKLESTKLKLTQITVSNNDKSSSHRNNNSIYLPNESSQVRRIKTLSNGVQTESGSHFLKLNKTSRKEFTKMTKILPLLLESFTEQQLSILDYNDKLQKPTDYAQNKCRVYNTFHRVPCTPLSEKRNRKNNVNVACIYEDLNFISMENQDLEIVQKKYNNIFNVIKQVLHSVECELKEISQRVTTAFHKEMDERYIEATSRFTPVDEMDLLRNRSLYKDEQAVTARRMSAVLANMLQCYESHNMFRIYEEESHKKCSEGNFLVYINRICNLLDSSSCAILFSGFLMSLTIMLEYYLLHYSEKCDFILDTIRVILASRPMPFVTTHLLRIIRKISAIKDIRKFFCPGTSSGNLKVDYDQGMMLYKKDSCYIQVLLNQIEAALKCVEKQQNRNEATQISRHLIAILCNSNDDNVDIQETTKCECHYMLQQVCVYSLKICAIMMEKIKDAHDTENVDYKRLSSVTTAGVRAICGRRTLPAGHLMQLCDTLTRHSPDHTTGNILAELMNSYQVPLEETTTAYHKQPWLKSFESFSITD